MSNEQIWVCSDCIQVIANGDATGLDYSYSEKAARRKLKQIEVGIEDLQSEGGQLIAGEETDEFSVSPCECCCSALPGDRYECLIYTHEEA